MEWHNKYYYEKNRNGWTPDNARQMNGIKSKEDSRVPEYYKGKNNYQARYVVDNFDLTYHLGTATTYILRAYHKHDSPVECITKAIAHLEFELEKINSLNG